MAEAVPMHASVLRAYQCFQLPHGDGGRFILLHFASQFQIKTTDFFSRRGGQPSKKEKREEREEKEEREEREKREKRE